MTIEVNDIIMILDEQWNGCIATVTEVKSWGVQCFVKVPMQGDAHYRVSDGDYVKVGTLNGVVEVVEEIVDR